MKVPLSYANAVAISAQKNLIPKSRFYSAAEAKTPEDALKLLTSGSFGNGVGINGVNEYEKLAEEETVKLKEFLDEYSRGNSVRFYCFLKSDFFNCDAAVRTISLGVACSYKKDVLTGVEEIEAYVKNGAGDLPDCLRVVIEELKVAAGKPDVTGAELSLITLRNYYAAALKLIRNGVIRDLIKTEIDCANVSAYVRSKDGETAERQFISGGKLKKEKLKLLLSGDAGKARDAFVFTPYIDFVDTCLKAGREKRPLSEFEKITDDYPLTRLDGRRYETDGIIPALLYAVYKRAEIKNFRTVISGKLAGAPAEVITGRLRNGYVG